MFFLLERVRRVENNRFNHKQRACISKCIRPSVRLTNKINKTTTKVKTRLIIFKGRRSVVKVISNNADTHIVLTQALVNAVKWEKNISFNCDL